MIVSLLEKVLFVRYLILGHLIQVETLKSYSNLETLIASADEYAMNIRKFLGWLKHYQHHGSY